MNKIACRVFGDQVVLTFVTGAAKIAGQQADVRPDLGTVSKDVAAHWDQTRAPWQILCGLGEVETTPRSDNSINVTLQLGASAHEISRAQYRRFVLTFSLEGSTLRFCVFHRGGVAADKSFDVHKDPIQFLKLLWLMTCAPDEFQGLDPTIRVDKAFARKLRVPGDTPSPARIRAEQIPIGGHWLNVE